MSTLCASSPFISNSTEEYGGTSWTAGGNMTTARRELAGGGTQTAALGFGGYVQSVGNDDATEEYNGSSWTNGGNLGTARTKLAGAGGLTGSGGTNGTYGGSNRHKNNGTYDFSNLWNGTLTDINDTWGSYNSAGTVSNTPTTSYYLYFTFPTATAVNQYNIWKRPQYNNGDTWSTHAPGTWELRGTNDIASYDRKFIYSLTKELYSEISEYNNYDLLLLSEIKKRFSIFF